MESSGKDFKNRIYDLAERSSAESRYVFTDFLTPAEQLALSALSPGLPVGVSLYGGYAEAERRIARFGSADELGYEEDFPTALLKISPLSEKYAEELTHRDYLGSVLALGIDRRVTGDIIIQGKHAWLICLEHISGHIQQSLTCVRHTSVKVTKDSFLPHTLTAPPDESCIYVPSLRLDAVISKALHLSRAEAQRFVTAEKVFVNSVPVLSTSHMLKDGDLVSVRGKGRFRYTSVRQQTRKGNLCIGVRIYPHQ